MTRPRFVVLALLALLVLTGCTGGSSSSDEKAAPKLSAADTLAQTGLRQLQKGEDEKARATFENVLQLDSGNVFAHYNLGLLAQGDGKTSQAIKQYDAALKTDPKFTSALYNKGILLETTDVDGAVALYRRAVAADPKLAPAHMRLGFALLHLGEKTEAEKHLATGLKLDPAMAKVQAPSYE